MRILLVQPKMNLRPMDTKLKIKMAPSLALLTLKNLTPPTHQVIIINENIEKINFNEKIDVVGITVTVDVFERAVKISDEFRKRGVAVVAGGIHISADPDKSSSYFDAVCVGMAERVWKRILDDVTNNRLQKIYCDMDNMKGSEISSPTHEFKNSKKYLYTNIISTSRGCPHKCDFCYNSCKNAVKYINRPVEDVFKEIIELKTKHIMFIDDNFIGNPSWTRELLLLLKPLCLKWNAAVTVNIFNNLDLLDLMKETGCQSLFIGFETINRASLECVHKRQNDIGVYNKLISEIHSRGIMINASIVFGLPDDDSNIFDDTLNWLIDNKIETVTAHILTPYPGTVLYNKMLKENEIKDFNLSHYNTAHVVFVPQKMSEKQLYDGYIGFYKKFYTFKNIFKRMPDNKNIRMSYLLFNLFYRKFGKLTELVSTLIPLNYLGKLAAKISYHIK